MYYVYVLLSLKDNKKYVGSTADIKKRFLQHQNGLVPSTKSRKPFRLLYYESFSSKKDALREEIFLKSGKGRERLDNLLTDY